ncbi:hypothetical protein [Engelhardtia mirabilis]|uniref:Uncharacterized protein n=1 Tax=Engelhardtia mirabilis TaxID=2528011 RepID=A0A518BLW3_9BACT|nr:hypothetical protein Pla133_30440 [Planctomycetes bacterium Pla133]QDV02279.1 hypothetical protein Pla86_30430 [Planctomycetes bacterium Pla86]
MTDASASPTPPAVLQDLPEGATLLKEGKIPFRPKERKLETAPLLLNKAAWVLVVGSLIPWYGHDGGWVTTVAAKAVVALGCFLLYCCVVARTDDPVPAGLGALGKARWGPEWGTKTRGFKDHILQLIPTPLHILAFLVAGAGFLLPLADPQMGDLLKAMVEVGSLLLGGGTLVHIFAYRKGAHFSPIFPMLFIGPALAGTSILIQTIGGGNIGSKVPALLGSILSAGAGLFAVYTMVLALMEAKKEGDAKKAAAVEARKAARAARKS